MSDFDIVVQKLRDQRLTFSVCYPEVVAVVRKMVEQDRLSASQIMAKFGSDLIVSRSSVISFCHRAHPPIEFHPSLGGKPRKSKEALPGPALSTRDMRLRNTMMTKKAYPNDPRYTFACPTCLAKPTFACFTIGRGGKLIGLRPHAERVELNRKHKISTEAPAATEEQVIVNTRKRYQPKCTWFGCTADAMEVGKPYCREHHEMSGALMPVRNVYTGRQW